MTKTTKMTAAELVKSRLKRLAHIHNKKPGSIRETSMLWAFIRADQKVAS